ncbi:MAG: Zn-ribbon-containing protein [Phormidesmis priestleyi Ana]|uniref:Zn-ribbon-containing protein n=1 Tax=Phormidesmis priestleyi Ana TaxID=1666911 RepID=A0A0P8BPR5_9CYAN|nr:MAG: Zn-ribbon-containing protein [Phormidesmis priestleyi Ana]
MALEGLKSLIKGLEDQESWKAQKQFRLVLLHWPKSVGFAVARVTRPVGIQRGSLYVATATATWAQTLSYERLTILHKLNRYQRLPLKGIRFSTAQWTHRNSTSDPNKPPENNSDLPSMSPGQDNNPQAKGRLANHPSYIGDIPHLPKSAVATPEKAFEQWASMMQKMQTHQALCPRCRCHCPQGELKRWAICALCAAKQWQN